MMEAMKEAIERLAKSIDRNTTLAEENWRISREQHSAQMELARERFELDKLADARNEEFFKLRKRSEEIEQAAKLALSRHVAEFIDAFDSWSDGNGDDEPGAFRRLLAARKAIDDGRES